MPDFRYILFDLDGTLTDSAPGITASVKYALKKSGEPVPDYTVLCKFIGPPLLYGFMSFCGMSEERAEKAVEYYREYYSVNGIFESELYPGVKELLAKLCAAGKKNNTRYIKAGGFRGKNTRAFPSFGLLLFYRRSYS